MKKDLDLKISLIILVSLVIVSKMVSWETSHIPYWLVISIPQGTCLIVIGRWLYLKKDRFFLKCIGCFLALMGILGIFTGITSALGVFKL